MIQYYIAWAVLYGFVFITGICIGSFLNVLIYRIPAKKSFAKGRSFCPGCGHTLGAADLVPIMSYLVLRGRCRYCKAHISIRYPLIELLGGVLAVISTAALGMTWRSAAAFVVLCILTVIALIDADTMEIPDGLNGALFIMAPVWLLLQNDVTWRSAAIGFFSIALPMIIINLMIPESFGGGDIKLCAACGLLLGWQNMLVAAMIALITGGIYGAYLLITHKKDRKDHFAFGPFLAFGIMISLLAGDILVNGYLHMFNLV